MLSSNGFRYGLQEFAPRGRVIQLVSSSFNLSGAYAVQCALHPEAGYIPIQVDTIKDDFHTKVREAFDSCKGCEELNLRKAARSF
jgi:hypothetical protein